MTGSETEGVKCEAVRHLKGEKRKRKQGNELYGREKKGVKRWDMDISQFQSHHCSRCDQGHTNLSH